MSTDRRSLFRAYLSRVNPTVSPAAAMKQGFYVDPPHSLPKRIADALELEPSRSHLLSGAIGSGKTTTLLAIQERLDRTADIRAIWIDLPSKHRLEVPKAAVLTAVVGLAMIVLIEQWKLKPLSKDTIKRIQNIKDLAHGYVDPYYRDDNDDSEDWVPGVLNEPAQRGDITALLSNIKAIMEDLPFQPVILVDGLDRLEVSSFDTMVREDLPALTSLGIGLVVVAPAQVWFDQHRQIRSLFFESHLHSATSDLAFLQAILRKRADPSFLPDPSCALIAQYSGGLLRDLVEIARAAGLEAYGSDADTIEPGHVKMAVQSFGRSLLFGINQKQGARLKDFIGAVSRSQIKPMELNYTLVAEIDIQLLMGRLLIEIPSTPPSYRVHPAIVSLIPGLPT